MPQLLISAANKSSGKTIVSTGICAALHARGKVVQPFKKGPDYIDPMWLGTAARRSCYNLDFWTQTNEEITQLFHSKSHDADLALIEANKGLYDGLDLDGSNSNAALAKLLQSPVILTIDCRGTIRGIAPLLLGYQEFDKEVDIKGVILNFVGGDRHEQKLRRVIEHYTDLTLVGAIRRDESLLLEERYLGLIPSNEQGDAVKKVDDLGNTIAQQIDLDKLLSLAHTSSETTCHEPISYPQFPVTIAYAKDEAFGFYYPDDLEIISQHGAKLVPINMMSDTVLPDVDGLFIGGGFPEKYLTQLEGNTALRTQIYNALSSGLPTYAECGGLMYLCKQIHYQGKQGQMVGLIDADCEMTQKPQGRGYIQFKENAGSLWRIQTDIDVNAHEFHYSHLENLASDTVLSFEVSRGLGVRNKQDGICIHNTLACYAHQRHTQQNPWISRFLEFVYTKRKQN